MMDMSQIILNWMFIGWIIWLSIRVRKLEKSEEKGR